MKESHRPFFKEMSRLRIKVPENYTETKEWKLWKAGYNAAVESANDTIKKRYNLLAKY
jgi:hypothetical protein